jgi:LysR substrate binding domain.
MPDELQQINAGVERQVNIVINNLLYQPQTTADLLTWLHQQFPFTRFQISRQVYMGVWDSLLYDDFQLAIGVTGSESLSNNISLLPLGDISWQFVVAATHPLATHPAELLSDDVLRRYPAINIEDTSRT